MKLTIVGTGYVGLVTGTCFAEMGNYVTCIDKDPDKIKKLKEGIVPIYEPGLEAMVKRNVEKKSLLFSTDLRDSLNDSEMVFIAVGTPMGEDGSADLQHVLAVAEEIGKIIEKELIVVNKSTVPVGTADKVWEAIMKQLEKRSISLKFHVASNPEFLKEGAAVQDFMRPDRVVVGTHEHKVFEKFRQLYYPFVRNHDRMIEMDVRSAEMTKYAANAMLATKISFINEIGNICEIVGADVNMVRIGIGSDSRIGYDFIYPGIGYGGSCFPKDVKALRKFAADHGYEPKLLTNVEKVNEEQKEVIVKKIIARFGNDLSGLIFAVWGLAFKPGTDDMREAPSIVIIKKLIAMGATIRTYDPKAMEEAKHFYFKDLESIEYFDSKYDVLKHADAMLLLTEWKEFRSPDFGEIKKQLKSPVIFDGRNQYINFNLDEEGFEYYLIGKE